MKGLASPSGVVDAIWVEFADTSVVRLDGELMNYNHDADATMDGAGMLADTGGRGQCTAWAELLVMTLGLHGITATSTRIDPPGGPLAGNKLAVIAMPAQGTEDVDYIPGTFAAGGFFFHQVVRVPLFPGRMYDPSYGGLTDQPDWASAKSRYEIDNMTHFRVSGTWIVNPPGDQLVFDPD